MNKVRSDQTKNPLGKTISVQPANGIMERSADRYLEQYNPTPSGGDIPTQFEERGLSAENRSNVVRTLRTMGKAPQVSGSGAKTTGNKIRKVGMTRQAGRK